MWYFIIFIVVWVIWVFFYILGQFLSWISSINEENKKRKEVIEKYNRIFWNRNIDKSKPLLERNQHIIDHYLVSLRKPRYDEDFYIEKKAKECVNDILISEWLYNDSFYEEYNSSWKKKIPGEYISIYENLISQFNKRIEYSEVLKNLTQTGKETIVWLWNKLDEYVYLEKVLDEVRVLNTGIYEYEWMHYLSIENIFPNITIENNVINYYSTQEIIDNTLQAEISAWIEFIIDAAEISWDYSSELNEQMRIISDFMNDLSEYPLTEKENKLYLKSKNELKKNINKFDQDIKDTIAKLNQLLYRLTSEQNEVISKITEWIENWDGKSLEALVNLIILHKNINPFFWDFISQWKADEKILVINYEFPELEKFPNIKTSDLIEKSLEITKPLPKKQFEELYDSYLCSTTLRILRELYIYIENLESIVFNGWVHTINKWTWRDEEFIILSIITKRQDLLDINLSQIDPKIAFRSLRWISASKLSSLTPISPILKIDTSDHRFVDWYGVIEWMDSKQNLAAMDWQDFENLIRELFWKEFWKNWWEVKITQASRDWWVDAIAFDPDPIRWWKIVIQAKRYTNTVDVSAVRDLHGTVQHEWANKGILVTTSIFWADSYAFVKNKPLTLFNWGELLSLLEKHGYSAKIDLREAKKILNLKQR